MKNNNARRGFTQSRHAEFISASSRFTKGFTLIELLVVVLIIGILAAIAVPQYQKAVYKSRAIEAVTILDALIKAQEIYFLENGEYTSNLANLDIHSPPELKGKNADETSSTYLYRCDNDDAKGYPRNCVASTGNANMPDFDFHTSNYPIDSSRRGYLGKKWCRAYNKKEMALQICKSMGTSDPEAWKPEL
ncbi:MAG: prepilin-type N-terminal cleavage/methylation domain-containing protein, partial [Elusimicrobiaceae bacterium]|nr:prepilin-type N-terminal cleavage/methylation domain-containing protein [Elusimicrobiaceae bacterium]